MPEPSIITSRQNPAIKLLRALLSQRKAREREGLFAVEGARLVGEALRAGWPVHMVLVRHPARDAHLVESLTIGCRQAGARLVPCVADVLDSALDVDASVDAVGLVQLPRGRAQLSAEGPLAAFVLEDVRDPGNLGTILRTAHAAGMSGVVLTGNCADPFSPKAVRAASGALFRLPLLAVLEPEKVRGILPPARHWAACAAGGEAWDRVDARGPCALWLGNEAHGLSDRAVRACDGRIHVPIVPAAESLNVASTAAVLAFEVVRQRRDAAPAGGLTGETR